MPLLPNIITHAASCFSWFDPKHGVVDASDLGCVAGRSPFSQVFDDAADRGCVLYSARTGRHVLFTLLEVLRDREGDITGWVLTDAGEIRGRSLVYVPSEIKITIYND